MKTVWLVYPYGSIPGEANKDARYIKFGKRLADKYTCVWWTANYSIDKRGFRSRGREERIIQKGLKAVLIPTIAYYRNISLRRVAFEFLFIHNLKKAWDEEEKPDLIITPGTGMLTAFRPVWPYIKDRDVKAIYDIMDIHLVNTYFKQRHILLYPLVRLVMWISRIREKGFYLNVVGLTGLGKNQLEIAKRRTGNRDIPLCLIYNGIYVAEFREKMKQPVPIHIPEKKDGWIWCIYAGSLGPSYDISTLINCAKKCEKAKKKIMFIVVGTGDFAEKCATVDSENFIFLGYVDNSFLPSLYAKCDVGLSIYADFSTVDMPDKFYDYTAAGLAIVNSLNGEIRDHIELENLGIQYKAGDSKDLYNRICELENPEFLGQCKRNSWRVGDNYDLERQLDSLVELVDRVLTL